MSTLSAAANGLNSLSSIYEQTSGHLSSHLKSILFNVTSASNANNGSTNGGSLLNTDTNVSGNKLTNNADYNSERSDSTGSGGGDSSQMAAFTMEPIFGDPSKHHHHHHQHHHHFSSNSNAKGIDSGKTKSRNTSVIVSPSKFFFLMISSKNN